ncbi:hypothetical protein LPMP_341400 [Leishmania panamensis]|uniref:PIN domain-containing protein n=3 Tax=Leishmania guyanensis species complex TaxID=38579 RepID=A0A088SIX1_LEIPA|nr:hypothetical protein LPMP_341400 [Leishmania panamensis]AIO01767.1 hypothetical protein LPMP_341400 [Leishmania panamensis]
MSVVGAFYDEFLLYTQQRSSEVRLTHAAEAAMLRCLDAERASEALEVYEAVCRCGVVGMSSRPLGRSSCRTSPTRTAPHMCTSLATISLDQLAQRALAHVPHRKFQHSMLSLLMAAELDKPSPTMDYGNSRRAAGLSSGSGDLKASSGNAYAPQTAVADEKGVSVEATFLSHAGDPSAAEQARIRVQQRLHALHTTQQLRQPLGKEYCLVEMLQLCAPSAVGARASTAARKVTDEIEVSPLRTLSHVVLHHPFTHMQPSAPWAQKEMHWEEISLRVCAQALTPANLARLTKIEDAVSPYRLFCKSSLMFLARMVPNWDAVLVRRVAETLVLPATAHSVFPESYRRLLPTAAQRRRPSETAALSTPGAACGQLATPRCCTSWTDSATHKLFGEESGDNHASPLLRVEHLVKRRVHHDVVVPDTSYMLRHFQQLKQLARHREVIVTHSVFLDLVAAASLPTHPTRFHARRVLRDIMYATTTAVTGKQSNEAGGKWDVRSVASGSRRRDQLQQSGFTLLGLQDELALLERCPERFYLSEFSSAASLSDWALMGQWISLDSAARVSDVEYGSQSCVALVAKQLERMIATHDRGEDFFANSTGAPTRTHVGVDSLVQHILESNSNATSPTTPSSRQTTGPLFKNRSRGLWARMPVVVATTHDRTRAAAFTVGLRMYPPAGLVP